MTFSAGEEKNEKWKIKQAEEKERQADGEKRSLCERFKRLRLKMHKGKRRLSFNPKSFGYFSDSQDFELISKRGMEAFTKTPLNTLRKISWLFESERLTRQ